MAHNNPMDLTFFKQNNSQHSTNKLQTQINFQILFEGQNRQVLQLCIPPNCSTYIRGRVIYSNFLDEGLPSDGIFTAKISSKGLKMYLWRNKTNQVQVVGLTHGLYSGPILILDLSVYKQSMFVDLDKIVASKYSISNEISFHNKLRNFALVQFNNNAASMEVFFKNNQKIVLQANSNIIEKYLAPGEQFVLYFGRPVAISRSIFVQTVKKNIKLIGPGWVFFQTAIEHPKEPNTAKYVYIVLFLLFTVITNLIDY